VNCKRRWTLTYDVFVASWVTTLRRFGTTRIYVSSIGALHIDMVYCCGMLTLLLVMNMFDEC
jgi:hypothetical protein